jgi:glycosyltransferase involved in cell wall biosynthesis
MYELIFIGMPSQSEGGAEKYFRYLVKDFIAFTSSSIYRHNYKILYFDSITLQNLFRLLILRPGKRIFIFNISVLFQFSFQQLLCFLSFQYVVILPHLVSSPLAMKPKFKFLRFIPYFLNIYFCHKIICISDGNFQSFTLIPFFNLSKLHTVYNYPSFTSSLPSYQLSSYDDQLAIIGRLQNHHKGQIDFLINNGDFLEVRNLRLHLFGDGPDYNKIIETLANLNLNSLVSLHGFISNSEIYLNHTFSTVLCYSYWEGLPLNIIEAYATGKLVIGRNIPGVAEILFPSLRFSTDIELRSILSTLKHLTNDPLFRIEYSKFALSLLSKYSHQSAMHSMLRLFNL